MGRIYKDLLTKGISVRNKIAEVTGLTPHTVGKYLKDEYKITKFRRISIPPPIKPASQVIEKHFESIKQDYGKRLVERYREEVLVEEKPMD